jgi:hypothetical protein
MRRAAAVRARCHTVQGLKSDWHTHSTDPAVIQDARQVAGEPPESSYVPTDPKEFCQYATAAECHPPVDAAASHADAVSQAHLSYLLYGHEQLECRDPRTRPRSR